MMALNSTTLATTLLNGTGHNLTTNLSTSPTNQEHFLFIWFSSFVMFLENVYKIFIIVFGLIGNTITIIIFKRTKLAHSKLTSFYLISLALSDIIFLLVLLLDYLGVTRDHNLLCKINIYVPYMMSFLSCGLVLAFTVQRLCCIRFPLRVDLMNLERHSKAIVASLIIFACMFYAYPISVYDLVVEPPTEPEQTASIRKCKPKVGYASKIELFNFVDSVFTFCIPFLGILIMNGMIIQTLKNSSYNFILKAANNRHLNNEVARPGGASPANGRHACNGGNGNALSAGRLNTSAGSSTIIGQIRNDINGNPAQFRRLNECVQAGIGTAVVVFNNNNNNNNNAATSSPELNGNLKNGGGGDGHSHRRSYPMARYSFKFAKKDQSKQQPPPNENIQLGQVLPSVNIITENSSNSNNNGNGNKYSNNNGGAAAALNHSMLEHSFNHHKNGCAERQLRAQSNEPRNLAVQRDSSSFTRSRQSSRDGSDKAAKKSKCSCFLPSMSTSPPTPSKGGKGGDKSSKPYQSMFVSKYPKHLNGNGASREAENLLRRSEQDENSVSRSHVDSTTRNFSVLSSSLKNNNNNANNSSSRSPYQYQQSGGGGGARNQTNTQINFKKDGRHSVSLASTRRVNGIPDSHHSYSLRLNGNGNSGNGHGNHQNQNDPFYRNSFKSGGPKTNSVSRKITKMLIIVSSTFLLLNLPVHAFNVYSYVKYSHRDAKEMDIPYTALEENFAALFSNLFYTSFSCNFLLYSISGVTFRTEFKNLLVKIFSGKFKYFGK